MRRETNKISKKNRIYAVGEDHQNAVLTEEQVRGIIEMRKNGIRVIEIAKAFGRPYSTIQNVVRKKAWKHVKGN